MVFFAKQTLLSFLPPVVPDTSVPLNTQREASLKRLEKAFEHIYSKYEREFENYEEIDLLTGEVFTIGNGHILQSSQSVISFGSLTSYMDVDVTQHSATANPKRLLPSEEEEEVDEFILDSISPVLPFSLPQVSIKKPSRPAITFPSESLPPDELAVPVFPNTNSSSFLFFNRPTPVLNANFSITSKPTFLEKFVQAPLSKYQLRPRLPRIQSHPLSPILFKKSKPALEIVPMKKPRFNNFNPPKCKAIVEIFPIKKLIRPCSITQHANLAQNFFSSASYIHSITNSVFRSSGSLNSTQILYPATAPLKALPSSSTTDSSSEIQDLSLLDELSVQYPSIVEGPKQIEQPPKKVDPLVHTDVLLDEFCVI